MRRLSRQKKTAAWIFGGGLALGVGLYFLWPAVKRYSGTIFVKGPSLTKKPGAISPAAYTVGTPENKALNRAMDAWYALHPDTPFVNDDGSYNILPGYELTNV